MENTTTGDVLALIATDPKDFVSGVDLGASGAHLLASGPIDLGPNATVERVSWLVHSTDVSQLEAYSAALSQLRRLP